MRQIRSNNWEELHTSMLRSEGLGGAVILAFQVFIVAALMFS